MNPSQLLLIGFILPVVVMLAVTAIVARGVRRSPATVAWKATRDGVAFVVCLRRWQHVVIRSFGVVVIGIGCVIFVFALADHRHGSTLGAGVAGAVIAICGVLPVWLAQGMSRLRLEVAPDMIWAFPMVGSPRQVALSDITTLAPMYLNNYGGIVARSATKKLFSATRIMLGYPQLIDHLRVHRPDLAIPDASWPL